MIFPTVRPYRKPKNDWAETYIDRASNYAILHWADEKLPRKLRCGQVGNGTRVSFLLDQLFINVQTRTLSIKFANWVKRLAMERLIFNKYNLKNFQRD